MQLNDRCLICNKPHAYPLVNGNWYCPPVGPYWTPATSITLTLSAGTSTEGWHELVAPMLDYCYGHAFVRCPDCECQVEPNYHTPQQCAILGGMMDGIRQVAAYVEREEQIPASERLPGNVDVPEVPDVFQEAFKERERL